MRRFTINLLTLLFFLFPAVVSAAPSTIRLLYLNDFHGFAAPAITPGTNEAVGGAPLLAAKVASLRGEKPSLLLAAGDMIQGESWSNLFAGESVVALMNLMRFDAMVLGNHEFDFGREVLEQRIRQARFPVLGANVDGVAGLSPYVVKEIGGIRVAVVGLVTDETPQTSHPDNTRGLTFHPPLETAKRVLAELAGETDLIILLTHLGHEADRMLAESLPYPVVIIGGHSHTRVTKPVRIGRSLVLQAGDHGRFLGVLDLTLDGGKMVRAEGRLEEIKGDPREGDPATVRMVEEYSGRLSAKLDETVGIAAVDLVAERVRRQETNFGNLVADVVRDRAAADIAIINSGSIRTGIPAGRVSVREVHAALPFESHIVTLPLTGVEVRQALEHGLSGLEKDAGGFPQVSGLTFSYSAHAPPGKRLAAVRVGGRPLDHDAVYRVATLDFLAAGGDGYTVLNKAMERSIMEGKAVKPVTAARRPLKDLVIDHLKARSPVSPSVEGRIRVLPR